jgi:hypothetical protein
MVYIEKYKVLRWVVYLVIIINSILLTHTIMDNLRFTIVGKVFCPVFGTVRRCDISIFAGTLAIVSGIILLVLGVLSTTEEKKRRQFFYKSEVRMCLLQIPIWICFLISFITWSREVGASAPELTLVFICSLINIGLYSMAVIISSTETGVRDSMEY